MSSSFGTLFRITTFGESHGPAVGVIVDGCPPRLALTEAIIQHDLDRRRPGQSSLVTQRKEDDKVEILSGVMDGMTLGTPIALLVRNSDQRSRDYDEMKEKYRPSHADFAYDSKYGIRAWSGGGRASARETVGRVAAGAIARQLLAGRGVSVVGFVEKVHTIATDIDPLLVTPEAVEANPVRCPDPVVASAVFETSHVLVPLLFTPLLAGWSIWAGIAVSTRASDVRVAQQLATFASFQNVPSGACLNYTEIAGPGEGYCPPKTSGFSNSYLLAGPTPASGATVSNLYADTNATVTGSDAVTVAVIDNTTGATLLSCTVNSSTRNNCSNTSGSGSAAPGDNIEVRVTGAGSSCNNKEWRVRFRY